MRKRYARRNPLTCRPSRTRADRSACPSRFLRDGSGLQGLQEALQLGGKRRFDSHYRAAAGMAEFQAGGMQEHAFEPQFRQSLVDTEVAVLVVTCNRVADMRQMNPDLMCAPGL